MFSLKDYIKKGLILAVGKKPDYEIILASVSWLEKGVLLESDLAEVQSAIDNQYVTEEVTE
ncbi:MAG: hypothetical protein UIG59_00235 [Acutalibacteraceae bacterium]|nr:hypothetical protein [Acutalibacteraceae bacterium]